MTRMRCDRRRRDRCTGRRGVAVYILVIGVATILAMTGFTLLAVARADHRIQTSVQKSLQAQYVAQAGLEQAFYTIDANSTWRQTKASGTWFSDLTFGPGKYTVTAVDTDGSLSDDERDTLVVTSTGTVGDAVHKVKATLTPRPHPALAFAAFGYSSFGLASNAVARGPVRSNGTIWSDGNADAEDNAYFESVQGAYIAPELTPSRYAATAMSYPQPSLSYYLSLATPVAGLSGTTARLREHVLTPTRNSESSSQINANGIYALNCANRPVVVQDSRIKGTLILYNTAQTVTFQGSLRIEPAGYSYPSILIFSSQSNVVFYLEDSSLVEWDDWVDYNEDGDKLDTLATYIKGLIWTDSSYISMNGSGTPVTGCIIGSGLQVYSGVVCNDDPQLAQAMMPGFIDTNMKIVSGSYREVEP